MRTEIYGQISSFLLQVMCVRPSMAAKPGTWELISDFPDPSDMYITNPENQQSYGNLRLTRKQELVVTQWQNTVVSRYLSFTRLLSPFLFECVLNTVTQTRRHSLERICPRHYIHLERVFGPGRYRRALRYIVKHRLFPWLSPLKEHKRLVVRSFNFGYGYLASI